MLACFFLRHGVEQSHLVQYKMLGGQKFASDTEMQSTV